MEQYIRTIALFINTKFGRYNKIASCVNEKERLWCGGMYQSLFNYIVAFVLFWISTVEVDIP